MPWREASVTDRRLEFVRLASRPGANVSELCRRFDVARSNGYKWLERYRLEGEAGVKDRSRRPQASPRQSSTQIEAAVLRVRRESRGVWGGRKIGKVLEREGLVVPPSTVTAILRRHGELAARAHEHPGPWHRFERAEPNELWQMDFKGHFAIAQGRCHPLTVLDDHSRYALEIGALGDEQDLSVRGRLADVFRCYGLPLTILCDNGSPWGDAEDQPWTGLGVWLLRLGVGLRHGRAYHPQTQGKDERFHRTLKAEVIDGETFADLSHCQRAFDRWRPVYNHVRPHDALGLATPAERFRPSPRTFPEILAPIEYGPGDIVRKVDQDGWISFKNRPWRIGRPFRGLPVALRPTDQDGVFTIRFMAQTIARLDLNAGQITVFRLVANAIASATTPKTQTTPTQQEDQP